jgi:hypothetical protein
MLTTYEVLNTYWKNEFLYLKEWNYCVHNLYRNSNSFYRYVSAGSIVPHTWEVSGLILGLLTVILNSVFTFLDPACKRGIVNGPQELQF